MKLATPIAAIALLAPSTPLLATHGMDCVSRQRGAPTLYMSVGSGGGVDLVIIRHRGREQRATGLPGAGPRIIRGFLDDAGRLTLRIVGADGRTPIASLNGTGRTGVLRYRGRDWRVSCRWESQE